MFLGDLMSSDQLIKLHNWQIQQEKGYTPDELGAIGGAYTYSFTPTGLGTVIKVTNAITKAEIDLTDYDEW